MSSKLKRDLIQYEKCSPEAVAQGSATQMFYFVQDAKADIAALAARNEALGTENALLVKALQQIVAIVPSSNCDAGSMARSRMKDIALQALARRAREGGCSDG